jgi:hypothetical protein
MGVAEVCERAGEQQPARVAIVAARAQPASQVCLEFQSHSLAVDPEWNPQSSVGYNAFFSQDMYMITHFSVVPRLLVPPLVPV